MSLARICSGQLRLGPMGDIIGFDLTAVCAMAGRLGFDMKAMAILIGSCERGMIKGQQRAAN